MNPTLRETTDRLPCLSANADWWFDETPRALARAQSLCRTCPVMDQCLAGALERREPHGVWGGEIFSNGRVVGRKRARGRPPATSRTRSRSGEATRTPGSVSDLRPGGSAT